MRGWGWGWGGASGRRRRRAPPTGEGEVRRPVLRRREAGRMTGAPDRAGRARARRRGSWIRPAPELEGHRGPWPPRRRAAELNGWRRERGLDGADGWRGVGRRDRGASSSSAAVIGHGRSSSVGWPELRGGVRQRGMPEEARHLGTGEPRRPRPPPRAGVRVEPRRALPPPRVGVPGEPSTGREGGEGSRRGRRAGGRAQERGRRAGGGSRGGERERERGEREDADSGKK